MQSRFSRGVAMAAPSMTVLWSEGSLRRTLSTLSTGRGEAPHLWMTLIMSWLVDWMSESRLPPEEGEELEKVLRL